MAGWREKSTSLTWRDGGNGNPAIVRNGYVLPWPGNPYQRKRVWEPPLLSLRYVLPEGVARMHRVQCAWENTCIGMGYQKRGSSHSSNPNHEGSESPKGYRTG